MKIKNWIFNKLVKPNFKSELKEYCIEDRKGKFVEIPKKHATPHLLRSVLRVSAITLEEIKYFETAVSNDLMQNLVKEINKRGFVEIRKKKLFIADRATSYTDEVEFEARITIFHPSDLKT